MTTFTQAGRVPALRFPGTTLPASARGAIGAVVLWRDRARQRRALAALTPAQLADIGVDALSARREAAKPFWQA